MTFARAPLEHTVRAELVDLRIRIAELGQQLAAVLAHDQGRSLYSRRRLGKVERNAYLIQSPDEGMLVRDDPAAPPELRVVVQAERKSRVADLAGHSGCVEPGEPVGRRCLAKLRGEQSAQSGIVCGARPLAGEAGIRGERWRPDRDTETVPVLLGRRDHAQPPVGGLVQPVGGAETELLAVDPRPLESGSVRSRECVRGVQELRIDDRGVAELSLARALAMIERLDDRDRGEKTVAGVAQAAETPQRFATAAHPAILVLHARQAAAGLIVAR